jgi:hypothetical protein
MEFPLKEPSCVAVDRDFDNKRYAKTWDDGIKNKVLWLGKRIIHNLQNKGQN